MVILRPVDLHWINGAADDPADFCAHGDVEFRIGDDTLIEPAGRALTVSAAALYLLRTLSTPARTRPSEPLFPCCGFNLYDLPGELDVVISGCGDGEDFDVSHSDCGVGVVVRSASGRGWPVVWPAWRTAVFDFADRVSDFYATCSPKQPAADDAAGFAKFAAEWERRRGGPTGLTAPRPTGPAGK